MAVRQLISRLGDFEKKIGQDLADATKEIGSAEARLSNFEKLSHDKQFGKWYSQYLQTARRELQNATKRKDRLGARLEEVTAILQSAMDLRKQTHDIEADERQNSEMRSFNRRRSR
jgi:hypothetical protein